MFAIWRRADEISVVVKRSFTGLQTDQIG